MAQHKFVFINRTALQGTSDPDEDDLSTIRSHAMREVRRRRAFISRSTSRTNNTTGGALDSTCDKKRHILLAPHVGSKTLSYSKAFSNPYLGVVSGSNGPSVEVFQHLHYFIHGFTPLTFPTSHLSYSCDMLRIAAGQGSSAVVHALCVVSAIHRALTRATAMMVQSDVRDTAQNKLMRAFLRHKQCAIVSLQTDLSLSRESRNISSLAVVTLLLIVETLLGDAHTLNTHRLGLTELVKYHGMSHEPTAVMSSDVLMADIKSATSSLSSPSMKPYGAWLSELDTLKSHLFVPYRPELVVLGSGFMTPKVREALDPSLFQLFRAMRNVINAVEQNFDEGIDVSEVSGSHVLTLEHQLLSIQSSTHNKKVPKDNMSECCRIGALLYCNLCLWTWPRNTTLVKNLLSYLREAMSLWTPDSAVDEQHSVLLWLYFVGSFATSNRQERFWYMQGMNNVCRWLGIKTEDDLRTVLASLFYVDRLMGQHLTDCYLEIRQRSE